MPRGASEARSTRASLRNASSPAIASSPSATDLPSRNRSAVAVVISRESVKRISPRSRTSGASSVRSVSLASDTPPTSVTVTPALSLKRGPGRPRKSDLSFASFPSTSSSSSSNKRKRLGKSDDEEESSLSEAQSFDTSKDEELARLLQQDEFNESAEDEVGSSPAPTQTPGRQVKVRKAAQSARKATIGLHISDSADDSDDSDILSDIDTPSDSDESLEVPIMASRPAKRVRNNRQTRGRRRRTANTTARTSNVNGDADGDEDEDEETTSSHRLQANGWWNRRKMKRRQKLETAHPEIRTMWDDLGKVPVIEPVECSQPTSITRTLKSFQLEGLDWMIRQEKSSYKGGLLGDEMGMGKTIQAVSLIMSDFPAKAPSLVLVPPVALMQWQNEINAYTNGKLKILVVHNSNAKSKNLTLKIIKQYNVLLMSYNSLESMYRKQEKGWSRGEDIIKADSPVHAVHWHRIILDEAHSIKSRNTGSAKACFALKGKHKWCLSGTPVQNRIGEFFSLLRFLEVRPFADYFCEACPCAQLHWSIDSDYRCTHCGHSSSEHRSVFNEEILNPITENNFSERDAALDKLHMITARMMLRRLKKDYTSSMELPPKLVQVRNEFFSKIERDFSSSIMSNTQREFDTYVSRGVVLNNYANIFGLIMQMRQVANHPDLILRKNAEGGQNVLVCNICDEPAEDAVRSQCKHDFCRVCVKTYVNTCSASGNDADCPRCHIPMSIDLEQPEIEQDEDNVKKSSIINRIRMSDWTSSTKIELLIYELYKLRSSKRTLKSIVFSQFTSMLQLVEWRLRRAGFSTVMLDGSMTPVQRQRSIDYFMTHTHVEVFLVSLKAGGVALNLTEASRVFIIDPWWNPAAEWQSADRCHRIGQARPCIITRLVIEDSVESRMVQLQEKKASLIASTVNKDKVAMDKLTPEDLQFLFRGT